jgi:hypothetical protein
MYLRKGDVLKFSDELSDVDRELSVESSVMGNITSGELMRLIASDAGRVQDCIQYVRHRGLQSPGDCKRAKHQ